MKKTLLITLAVIVLFFIGFFVYGLYMEAYCSTYARQKVKGNECTMVTPPLEVRQAYPRSMFGTNGKICQQFSEELQCEIHHKFLGIL
jgi:hypothetical protein